MSMVAGINGIRAEPGVASSTYQRRLGRACEEFESIFISYMLKSAGSASVGSGLFGERNEGEIIRSLFNDNLALSIAGGGGIGLAAMLFERLRE